MIADFGLSRIMEEEKLSMLTEICGTPGVRTMLFVSGLLIIKWNVAAVWGSLVCDGFLLVNPFLEKASWLHLVRRLLDLQIYWENC